MAASDQVPSNRSLPRIYCEIEDNCPPNTTKMDAKRCAAINEETRAAIDNATALTERAAIELADLERRIAEFKGRLGQDPH
jgi:hypothetical protein